MLVCVGGGGGGGGGGSNLVSTYNNINVNTGIFEIVKAITKSCYELNDNS